VIGVIDRTVAWLAFRQLFVRRRLIATILLALVPMIVALLHRRVSPNDPEVLDFLATLCSELSIATLLPLAAVVFGTTVSGGEIDDGTIVYLLVKPLPRWRVVLSKYFVAVAATLAVVLPGVLLPWPAVGLAAVPSDVPVAFAVAGTFGAFLYCALFVLLGLVTRRSLVFGLGYIVALEFVLMQRLSGLKSLSIREYALTVAGAMTESQPDLVVWTVPTSTVWVMGTIILVGSLAAAIVSLRRYEIAERL
jgi:ABC-2 type transport system permease protein